MVHHRLNERESNPNPHVNFISALPMLDAESQEDARQLLRALAAQVKPIMKSHGFEVNSLEEYEHNKVFAGRNWNNGEVVGEFLRRADGTFFPNSWLMGTLCHELAHIKHMNHGPTFQALWTRLRNEIRELQTRGYYGDGYWSSGTRLADSAPVPGQGLETADFPEYICGGAQERARPKAFKRRRNVTRPNRPTMREPSLHTGAQTAKKQKAGARVTAASAFVGEGQALNDGLDGNDKKLGTGFGKRAASKRAREERALAAERRVQALKSQEGPGSSSTLSAPIDENEGSEDEYESIPETDQERRRAMFDTVSDSDLDQLKAAHTDFSGEFEFLSQSKSPKDEPSIISSTARQGKRGANAKNSSTHLGLGKMVQSEIKFRKKESLGLTGEGRTLSHGDSSGTT